MTVSRATRWGCLPQSSTAWPWRASSSGQDAVRRYSPLSGWNPWANCISRDKVSAALDCGCVCILAGGTGNPFFTTDTAAALRAVELDCDVLLKGTRVDGVYTADPEKDPSAVRYETLTLQEAIEKKLKVMDQTAFSMCSENRMPVIVFDMNTRR